MIVIEMENGGKIQLELDAKSAPITVENFLKLVKDGFYDGLTLHRVIPGFMIQGGCPDGTGMGGTGWIIKGEFAANGSMNPDSAGSQFFIMHQDAPHLDGQYAAFGHVVSGMEVVDEIAQVPTDFRDKPKKPVVIKSIKVVE